MFTTVYWIHQFDNSARLGIMARPRGDHWLDNEIDHLKKQGVNVLVSLLEKDEAYELGLAQQQAICKKNNIDFIHFPIADRDIPKTGDDINRLIDLLTTKTGNGLSVVIHCRMGIGRSSMIAAAILLQAGLKADHIIEHICNIRGLKVPDTDKQSEWIRSRQ